MVVKIPQRKEEKQLLSSLDDQHYDQLAKPELNVHLPPATSQTFCYDVKDINVGYSFKATHILYIWRPNTFLCILEQKWTLSSQKAQSVIVWHSATQVKGFILFGSVIKLNYFLLLLETLQQYLFVGRIKYSSLLQVLFCDVTGKKTSHNKLWQKADLTQ